MFNNIISQKINSEISLNKYQYNKVYILVPNQTACAVFHEHKVFFVIQILHRIKT